MIPKSLSASSILVSEACMARWKVENFFRTPQASSEPANVGTTCHFALEMFVQAVCIDGTIEWSNVKYLKDMYEIGYIETFNSTDFDTEAFKDGAALVAAWYDRNKNGLPNQVISCETKENFDIKTSAGKIPFNFIYDRLDRHSDEVVEVIDYKTIRAYIRAEDLKKKIQPRAYALAAQIKFPEAQRIWVTFDMLRHEGPVGVVFTREENAATYRYIKRAAERIISIDEEDAEETLNDECKWCIRKTSCDTLQKAHAGGTVHGLDLAEIADRKMKISAQVLALKYAADELDDQLVKHAEKENVLEFDAGPLKVEITARSQRKVNSNAVAHIVGPNLSAKYGNFTVTNVDKMLKSGELGPDQHRQVLEQISKSWGEPSAKVSSPNAFEEL